MKKLFALLMAALMLFSLAACNNKTPVDNDTPPDVITPDIPDNMIHLDAMKSGTCDVDGTVVQITEYDMQVNGEPMTQDPTQAVYRAFDMIYYEAGKGPTYGSGTEKDEHEADNQVAYLVVHITKPGTYILNGYISKGQVVVDLGEDAKTNPEAVVNLYLNGVKIENPAAPCILFQNVYECNVDGTVVSTENAGANVYLCDKSINILNGSYVAEIYDPETVVEADGKISAETLYKFDGAIHSCMSMNLGGESGIVTINAENEGVSSNMHMNMTGGIWYINAKNDGMNANADNMSVLTIENGTVMIRCIGEEGDGIDSNGWLYINGGTVTAEAASTSPDAPFDADKGVYINGGIVCGTGNMMSELKETNQNFAQFSFEKKQGAGTYSVCNTENVLAAEMTVQNDFTVLVMSSYALTEGEYVLYKDDTVLEVAKMEPQIPGIDLNRPGMQPDVITSIDRMPPVDVNMPAEPPQEPTEPRPDEPDIPAPPADNPDISDSTPPEGDKDKPSKPDVEYSGNFVIVKGGNYFIVKG